MPDPQCPDAGNQHPTPMHPGPNGQMAGVCKSICAVMRDNNLRIICTPHYICPTGPFNGATDPAWSISATGAEPYDSDWIEYKSTNGSTWLCRVTLHTPLDGNRYITFRHFRGDQNPEHDDPDHEDGTIAFLSWDLSKWLVTAQVGQWSSTAYFPAHVDFIATQIV